MIEAKTISVMFLAKVNKIKGIFLSFRDDKLEIIFGETVSNKNRLRVDKLAKLLLNDVMLAQNEESTLDMLIEKFNKMILEIKKSRKKMGLSTVMFTGVDFISPLRSEVEQILIKFSKPDNHSRDVNHDGISPSVTMMSEIKSISYEDELLTSQPQPIDSEEGEEGGEDEPEYDSDYFKKLHRWYEGQRSPELRLAQEMYVSNYEKKLFQFLLENIFSNKTKLSWSKFISQLSKLGFAGAANRQGNGSTWRFHITPRCELFINDENMRDATFNVHKYNGEGAVPSSYPVLDMFLV